MNAATKAFLTLLDLHALIIARGPMLPPQLFRVTVPPGAVHKRKYH